MQLWRLVRQVRNLSCQKQIIAVSGNLLGVVPRSKNLGRGGGTTQQWRGDAYSGDDGVFQNFP